MVIKVLKVAPRNKIPPPQHPHGFWSNRRDEKQCISPSGFWNNDEYALKSHRCVKTGSIKTDMGWLCGNHARVFARRGWINANLLRKILVEREKEKQVRAARRKACLSKGACI
jgi:hypothetical protein